jgi:hypothetical protein
MRMERMIEQASVVEAMRGAVVESRHRLHVAVVDAGGRLRASAGDPELQTFFRSAAKPFQVLPMVAAGAVERYGITPDEIALCCGSHSGEPAHVRTAERLLARVGAAADALVCGSHPPFHHPTRQALADAGLEPGRLHNNCSGKHAGMIALARARGWEVEGYERIDHPVQGAVMEELSRWTGLPADGLQVGNDGCGVVSFALPLYRMALAYARLAADARQDPAGPGGTGGGGDDPLPLHGGGDGAGLHRPHAHHPRARLRQVRRRGGLLHGRSRGGDRHRHQGRGRGQAGARPGGGGGAPAAGPDLGGGCRRAGAARLSRAAQHPRSPRGPAPRLAPLQTHDA